MNIKRLDLLKKGVRKSLILKDRFAHHRRFVSPWLLGAIPSGTLAKSSSFLDLLFLEQSKQSHKRFDPPRECCEIGPEGPRHCKIPYSTICRLA